jgi:hypothetical protein
MAPSKARAADWSRRESVSPGTHWQQLLWSAGLGLRAAKQLMRVADREHLQSRAGSECRRRLALQTMATWYCSSCRESTGLAALSSVTADVDNNSKSIIRLC